MTTLQKTVKRRIPRILPRQQDLTISLIPGGWLGFREIRGRREYRLPVITAYRLAVELEVKNAGKKKEKI